MLRRARTFTVEGRSMEPAFAPGSRVRAEPLTTTLPARGEAVVFRPPGDPERLDLKRVVGLPGEEVALVGGSRFRVGGADLEEPYARIPPPPPGDDGLRRWRLEPGEVFVAGDNRLHSTDSRHYGPVPLGRVLGRAAGAGGGLPVGPGEGEAGRRVAGVDRGGSPRGGGRRVRLRK